MLKSPKVFQFFVIHCCLFTCHICILFSVSSLPNAFYFVVLVVKMPEMAHDWWNKILSTESKKQVAFIGQFTNRRIIMKRKEDLENDNGNSRMPFPILCIFLHLDYERVLSIYNNKDKCEFTKNSRKLVYVISYTHSFRTALSCGR